MLAVSDFDGFTIATAGYVNHLDTDTASNKEPDACNDHSDKCAAIEVYSNDDKNIVVPYPKIVLMDAGKKRICKSKLQVNVLDIQTQIIEFHDPKFGAADVHKDDVYWKAKNDNNFIYRPCVGQEIGKDLKLLKLFVGKWFRIIRFWNNA